MSYYSQKKEKPCEVLIHAQVIEEAARQQIEVIAQHPAISGQVAVMPDCHYGAGCVVGFTGRFEGAVIPNIVGVDIGCGVMAYKLPVKEIDFTKLDVHIRENIPLGCSSHKNTMGWEKAVEKSLAREILEFCWGFEKLDKMLGTSKKGKQLKLTPPSLQIGSLGSGNHFCEVDQNSVSGDLYLVLHSGSRNLGLKVAQHFQNLAVEWIKEQKITVPKDLEYLPMDKGGADYMFWMRKAQEYAHYNRLVMLRVILDGLQLPYNKNNLIESVHNYISPKDNIVRKGAISAYKDETVLVPLNMSDGIIIGTGKSNECFNFSAPHGAGRLYGRRDMLRRLDAGQWTLDEYKASMNGVFTTSVSRATFDESKFAYKSLEQIKDDLAATVDIKAIMKPVYNLKASEDI